MTVLGPRNGLQRLRTPKNLGVVVVGGGGGGGDDDDIRATD